MEWKDTTSYSRGKERIPICWSAKIGRLRVSVLSSHIYYPGQWVMHCKPFYDTHKLDVETKEQAQAKALQLVKKEIDAIAADLADLANGGAI